jgi:hypothetical protein
VSWGEAWCVFGVCLFGFVVLFLAGVERGLGLVLAFGIIALMRAARDN